MLALTLSSGVMFSCATRSGVTVTSSDAAACAEWLEAKFGTVPDGVVLGIGSSDEYGVDLTDFEDDGYVIKTVGSETVIVGKTEKGLDRAVRYYAKHPGEDTVYHEGCRIKELCIFGTPLSEYVIEYPAANNPNMLFAADELSRLLEKACGVSVPVREGITDAPHAIELRHTSDPALRDEGYRYFDEDGRLVIEGAVKRGCSTGVYRFLENECGWDALIYGESNLRPCEYLDVPSGIEAGETPAFDYLCIYTDSQPACAVPANERANPTAAQNSCGAMTNCCHGMESAQWCGFDVRYEQMCYTSEENYETCLYNIESHIKARLAAGERIGYELKAIDIAQGDNSVYCMCAECRKIFAYEKSHAGAVLRFANRLSEELSEAYPGIYYQVFAYAESNQPPAHTVASPWVSVTFCTDSSCSNHPIEGYGCNGKINFNGRTNRTYAEWLEKWCEICDSVYVWHYALNQRLMGFTVIDTIYDDFTYFARIGVDGIFWQNQNLGLGFQRIEYELVSQINMNPGMTRDEFNAYYERFMKNEYGDAWELVDEYVKLWVEAGDLVPCWHCWGGLHTNWSHNFDEAFVASHFDGNVALFERALALADSREIEERIERLSAPMYYEGCFASFKPAYLAHDGERLAVLAERYEYMIEMLERQGFAPTTHFRGFDGSSDVYSATLIDEVRDYWIPEADVTRYDYYFYEGFELN